MTTYSHTCGRRGNRPGSDTRSTGDAHGAVAACQGHRPASQQGGLRDPRLPEARRGRVRMVRADVRHRLRARAGHRAAARRPAAGGRLSGRHVHLPADAAGDRREARLGLPATLHRVRRLDLRRRPGRPVGGRLRGVRGAAGRRDRTRRDRRAGGHEFADRELHGLSGRHPGRRAGGARAPAGGEVRRRVADDARGRARDVRRRQDPRRHGRRLDPDRALEHLRDGDRIPQSRPARRTEVSQRGPVLRRGIERGADVRGQARVHRRRRQFGRAGRDELRAARARSR